MKTRTFLKSAAFLAAILLTAGCGNFISVELSGRVGFSLSEAGEVEIQVQPCGLPIQQVRVAGAAEQMGDIRANPVYLVIKSEEGQDAPFLVNPHDIDQSWQVEVNEGLPDDAGKYLIASAIVIDRDGESSQASARIEDIRSLEPGQVMKGNYGETERLSNGEIVDQEEFLECP